MTIELHDGVLLLEFANSASAHAAATCLLDALAESAEVFDTGSANWQPFTTDWIWYEPHGVQHEPRKRNSGDDDFDVEDYDWKVPDLDEWGTTPPDDPALRSLWEEWGGRRWTQKRAAEAERFILKACEGRYLSMLEIASLIRRSPDSVRVHLVNPLVHSGELVKQYPGRRHPKQRFTAKVNGSTNKERS